MLSRGTPADLMKRCCQTLSHGLKKVQKTGMWAVLGFRHKMAFHDMSHQVAVMMVVQKNFTPGVFGLLISGLWYLHSVSIQLGRIVCTSRGLGGDLSCGVTVGTSRRSHRGSRERDCVSAFSSCHLLYDLYARVPAAHCCFIIVSPIVSCPESPMCLHVFHSPLFVTP